MVTFTELGLHEELEEQCQYMGWKPSSTQIHAVPKILLDKTSLVCIASRGTGGSGAYTLALLQKVYEEQKKPREGKQPECTEEDKSFYAFIITPTRERAIFISKQWSKLGHGQTLRDIRCVCVPVVGQVDKVYSKKIIEERPPHVFVGTPLRFKNAFPNKATWLSRLKHLKYLVLDQSDRFAPPVCGWIGKTMEKVSKSCKILLFAYAENSQVTGFQPFIAEYNKVTPKNDDGPTKKKLVCCSDQFKKKHLETIMENHSDSRTLIVTWRPTEVANVLTKLGISFITCSLEMHEEELCEPMTKLKRGTVKVLINEWGSTIPSLCHVSFGLVITYHLPYIFEDYVTMLVNCERYGISQLIIAMVTPNEKKYFEKVEKKCGHFLDYANDMSVAQAGVSSSGKQSTDLCS